MNIPRRISHDNIEFPQHSKIEVPEIAVDPLRLGDMGFHPFAHLSLFVIRCSFVLDVMNVLAFWIQACIEMWAVSGRFFSVRFNEFAKVPFIADPTSCPNAFLLGTVVAVLNIFDV